MISIQIGFYENTSQRPILKEIGLILNNKIREWINIRRTISRYLQSVEHQLTFPFPLLKLIRALLVLKTKWNTLL